MPHLRAERVRELLRQEISTIIDQKMRDPRLSMTTVTEVVLTPDLRHARVYVTVYGTEEERARTLEVLNRASGHIRSELGQRISVRYMPELVFTLDTALDRGTRIVELLDQIRTDRDEQDTMPPT